MAGPKPEPFLARDLRESEEFRKRQRERVLGTYELPPLRRVLLPPKGKREVHLVVGDSHSHPEESNHRFAALGNFVAEHAKDIHHVISLGDLADMASLLGIGKNYGPLFDGRRYWQDVDVAVDALHRIAEPLRGMRKRPKLWCLEGNHEERIARLLELEPRWRGVVGYPQDFLLGELGFTHVPFLEEIRIGGIAYCHYWKSPGASPRPVGGEMPSRAALLKYPDGASRVCGHSHRFEHYELAGTSDHRKISSLVAGCFFDTAASSHRWARSDAVRWRSGLLWLEIEDAQIRSWRWIDYLDVLRKWG